MKMNQIKELHDPTVAWFPAPVVLVSCTNGEKANIITIAWTGVVCSQPPLISVSIRPSRFSYKLISNSGEFVVNIPTSTQLEETKLCGSKTGKDTNKWAACGFTPVKATKISVPLIKECPINIECIVAPKSTLDVIPLCYSPKSGIFGESSAINEED